MAADERLLEIRMRNALGRTDETRAHLDASSTHVEISGDRLAMADAASDEDRQIRHVLAHEREDLLGKHAGGDRSDMTARLHALDDQRIHAGTRKLSRDAERGRESEELGAAILDPRHGRFARQTAGQHDMADLMLAADVDQRIEIRMHDDQIDAEGLIGPFLGALDFGGEQIRRHRTACEHAEAARIRNRRHQMPLGDPGHRTSQNSKRATQELCSILPKTI